MGKMWFKYEIKVTYHTQIILLLNLQQIDKTDQSLESRENNRH